MNKLETNFGLKIAIACGGTGGHLFPGFAVAEVLREQGCDILLIISEKEVDQQAVKSADDMRVEALPAVGFSGANFWPFFGKFLQSYRKISSLFKRDEPDAILAMGSFTSAPPVLAGKLLGCATFLHEANAIPGRANRLLAPFVDQVFANFPTAAKRLRNSNVLMTGMPVRRQFAEIDKESSRMALGLHPNKPVLLVMGGSQGAGGINDLMMEALPRFESKKDAWQFLHLTGSRDFEKIKARYQGHRALVRPFLTEMEYALGAATAVISRAGASSLAEMAAMKLPAILLPYPFAADNHQYFNALELVKAGAARFLTKSQATAENLGQLAWELMEDANARLKIVSALEAWHAPNAAERVADAILRTTSKKLGKSSPKQTTNPMQEGGGRQTLQLFEPLR